MVQMGRKNSRGGGQLPLTSRAYALIHVQRLAPSCARTNKNFKVVNKTAAGAAQFAKCILLHTYSRTNASSQLREKKQKLRIAYLTSWHNSIFGYN